MKNITKIKHVSELPEWFDLEKYKDAEKLTISGWMKNLFWRFQLAPYLNDPIWEKMEEKSFGKKEIELWEKIKSNPVECDHGLFFRGGISGIGELTPNDLISGLAILGRDKLAATMTELKGRLDRDYNSKMETPPEWLQFSLSELTSASKRGKEFIKVNTRLPDEILVEDFKKWLKNKRKENEEHDKTRKARKSNLSLWVSCGVLPYIDLTIWAKIEQFSIPDRVYADAVFPYGDGGEDKIRKTTAPLARDLMTWESLHSLIDQAAALGKDPWV